MAPSNRYRLLIVEDDPLFARTLRLQLAQEPFDLTFCAHTALALEALGTAPSDLVLLDIHLGGHEEGLVALPKLIAAAPGVPVVVHSVLSDHATVVRAMRQGAHDYIPKHVGIKTLGPQLLNIIHQYRRQHAASLGPCVGAKRSTPDAIKDATKVAAAPAATHALAQKEIARPMLGESPAMQVLHRAIAQAKRSQGSVIILGEPGSGKELVARALCRPQAPFVAVDASTLDANLATGLLFGHERGAFTGAEGSRAGLFEQAHGGVLYFDEMANMTLDVQAKLLRVLQEREVTRLGGHKSRPLTFRLICATHADLPAMSRAGQFRFDLLTRLQVFVLQVPPLRQRLGDVPLLFETFVARFCQESQVPKLSVAPSTLAPLRAHPWPGNVRELEHAAQFAVAACCGSIITPEDLPDHIATATGPEPHEPWPKTRPPMPASHDGRGPLAPSTVAEAMSVSANVDADDDKRTFGAQVQAFERRTLGRAYAASGGNISALARRLGMDRSSLYAKLRQYGIHTSRPH